MSRTISDPRLAKAVDELYAACKLAEDYNYPTRAVEKIGSRTQPGSRAPGEQQCEWLVKRLAAILNRAVDDLDEALERSRRL